MLNIKAKFQQEFIRQMKQYPCFDIIEVDEITPNTTIGKGTVLNKIRIDSIDEYKVEDKISPIVDIYIRFLLRTLARGCGIMEASYTELGSINIPNTFKLGRYVNIEDKIDTQEGLNVFYPQFKDKSFLLEVPTTFVNWTFEGVFFDDILHHYALLYEFEIGLKLKELK